MIEYSSIDWWKEVSALLDTGETGGVSDALIAVVHRCSDQPRSSSVQIYGGLGLIGWIPECRWLELGPQYVPTLVMQCSHSESRDLSLARRSLASCSAVQFSWHGLEVSSFGLRPTSLARSEPDDWQVRVVVEVRSTDGPFGGTRGFLETSSRSIGWTLSRPAGDADWLAIESTFDAIVRWVNTPSLGVGELIWRGAKTSGDHLLFAYVEGVKNAEDYSRLRSASGLEGFLARWYELAAMARSVDSLDLIETFTAAE